MGHCDIKWVGGRFSIRCKKLEAFPRSNFSSTCFNFSGEQYKRKN